MAKARNISAIILAAGLSRRMGRNKLLLPFRGKSLVAWVLSLAVGFSFHEIILVSVPATLDVLQSRNEIPDGVKVLVNSTPERGQSASLRIGVESAGGDAYLFFTGDQPLLDRDTIAALLAKDTPGHIVVPTSVHGPCSPALFCATFRDFLLAVEGDAGGRGVREKFPELCIYVNVPNPSLLMDIDTPGQYRRLLEFDTEGSI